MGKHIIAFEKQIAEWIIIHNAAKEQNTIYNWVKRYLFAYSCLGCDVRKKLGYELCLYSSLSKTKVADCRECERLAKGELDLLCSMAYSFKNEVGNE